MGTHSSHVFCVFQAMSVSMITFLGRRHGAPAGIWWCRPHWRGGTPRADTRPPSPGPPARAGRRPSAGRTRGQDWPRRLTLSGLRRELSDNSACEAAITWTGGQRREHVGHNPRVLITLGNNIHRHLGIRI